MTTTSTFPPSFAEPPSIDGLDLSRSGAVRWCFTGRAQGDLSRAAPVAVARLGTRLGVPIVTVRQVHGAGVHVVGEAESGRAASSPPIDHTVAVAADMATELAVEADGMVTARAGVGLGVRTADCAPVLMWSPEGVLGAAHGGWAGLEAGIIDSVAASMAALGATSVSAVLGPCIAAECYEFGVEPLARLVDRFGPEVRATSAAGGEALDMRAAVAAAARSAGVNLIEATPPCTGCGGGHFSHRARAEHARQLSIIWKTDDPRGTAKDDHDVMEDGA